MSDTIINVEGLGKKYVISHEKQVGSYTALRDVISNKARSLFKASRTAIEQEEFWALKDISFKVNKGEAVGIIGRNGAGKSTLLKMLSRITEPTLGRIDLSGRVASLLEVGTGFHPELTGRENIFLNGAILGMTRVEIRKKFDEIVDFSGVEKFLDTPVKRYSSGMYVRLAFAVAAHLEPEILVVDEVLAVGDAEFQKKCLGKMEEVSKNYGRTVLFVSHNLGAVRKLCTKGLYLNKGQIAYQGDVDATLDKYASSGQFSEINGEIGDFNLLLHPLKSGSFGIQSAALLCNGIKASEVLTGANVEIEMTVKKNTAFINPEFGLVLKNSEMESLIGINNNHLGVHFKGISGDTAKIVFSMPRFKIFGHGVYFVNLYFGDEDMDYEIFQDAFTFTLQESDVYNSGKILDKNWNKLYDDTISIYIK